MRDAEQLSMLLSPPFTPRACCADVDRYGQQACVRPTGDRYCLACYLFGPWALMNPTHRTRPEFADSYRHRDDCEHRA